MGGMGSGRSWHLDAKDTTDNYRSIDVRYMKREGLLRPHLSFSLKWSSHDKVIASIRVFTERERITLSYSHRSGDEGWKETSYPVYLEWTDCNLGGQRPWFICPAPGCRRRVAILYGRDIFACRHCYQLAYPSQREGRDDRAARKANHIRKKLGWKPGILNDRGDKPEGMHWRTFDRLVRQHDMLSQTSFAGLIAQLNQVKESLDD